MWLNEWINEWLCYKDVPVYAVNIIHPLPGSVLHYLRVSEDIPCVKCVHDAKCLTCIVSFYSYNNPVRQILFYSHFDYKETEGRSGKYFVQVSKWDAQLRVFLTLESLPCHIFPLTNISWFSPRSLISRNKCFLVDLLIW